MNRAVGAVYEGVNELESNVIPLLASPQGGEGCVIKKISRSHRSRRSRGGFPTAAAVLFSIGKPPRPRDQRMLRKIFLIARPPLLAVMQGGEYCLIPIHSHLHRPPYKGGGFVFPPAFQDAKRKRDSAQPRERKGPWMRTTKFSERSGGSVPKFFKLENILQRKL